MPYIHVRTNQMLSDDEEQNLKTALGEAITLLPGKTEDWLMVDLEGDARLWFAGDKDRLLAIVEVDLLGKSDKASYEKLTARICDIMEKELNVPADGVYVKYGEYTHWGYNKTNF